MAGGKGGIFLAIVGVVVGVGMIALALGSYFLHVNVDPPVTTELFLGVNGVIVAFLSTLIMYVRQDLKESLDKLDKNFDKRVDDHIKAGHPKSP